MTENDDHNSVIDNNGHRGTLYLRVGPMYSSKTTWLNAALTELADQNFSVLKVVHSDDIRTDTESSDFSGTTHNSSFTTLSKKIAVQRVSKLSDVNISGFHVVGVDEAQFFPDLLTIVTHWVEDKSLHVRVVGLDGDAFKGKFGQVLDLIPISDEAVKLHARCKFCLDQLKQNNFRGNILSITAPFTKRMGSSKEQKLVGGPDTYVPVCRYHHNI